ncbi:MAG: DsbA family protein [Dehalococcoidia bacterium]
MNRLEIIAYSDYVCPWCYIGLHRIEQLQREFPVDVTWRPFELHRKRHETWRYPTLNSHIMNYWR